MNELADILIKILNECERVEFGKDSITLEIGGEKLYVARTKDGYWYQFNAGKGSK